MTPEDLAALERGCCTRPQAAASGCRLCVERYAAIDRVRAELDTLRRAAGERRNVWPSLARVFILRRLARALRDREPR